MLCVHQREDTLFLVESGCYEFVLGMKSVEVGPGAVIFVPRLVPHTFRVVADETSRMTTAYFPAGLENFQRLFACECATGAPHMTHIAQLGQKFGLAFLAPKNLAQHCARANRDAVIKLPQAPDFPEQGKRPILSADETGSTLKLIEWQMSPGSQPQLCAPHDEDAIFLIREGCWEFEIGGARVQAGPNCAVFAPYPHPQALRVIGTETGNLLLLSFPSG